MGWWGFGPMEGDAPLDCECEIASAVGLDLMGDAPLVISSTRQIETVLSKLEGFSDVANPDYIAWHALAVMIMRGGGPLLTIRDRVLQAIDDDVWAKSSAERLAAMQAFRVSVENYVDGRAYDQPAKGLFETIYQHMNSGKSGLVNVV